MDETPSNENPQKDFNKIDLTQLQGFSFGTQWTQDKGGKPGSRDDRRRDGPDRSDQGPNMRRDRRGFSRPAGPGGPGGAPAGGAPSAPPREGGDDRGFRGGPGAGPGGPRRDDGRPSFGPRREGGGFRGPGGPRGDDRGFRGGPGGPGGPREPVDRGPYISPFFNFAFYPEDSGFTALAKAIRTSCRTYELFEIARVIIGKNDRFVAVLTRKAPEGAQGGEPTAPSPTAAPFALSVPDGMPFENEEAAVSYVLSTHLGQFFDMAEVEVEPPKGSFQVINRCTLTNELLGPPNYHRYNQIVMQHFTAKVSRMSIEAYRTRIETVRDPELVNQWLEKMKKTTRYTWKFPIEGEVVPSFDNLEDARVYLLTNARDKVVKTVDNVRFHGRLVDTMPQGEIKRSIEGALERQRRFPLDTANALRGRLRREGFTIFKKGSKGVSYVCAVKRKFRVPGQTFADSIGALIAFIEATPMVRASELPVKFLKLAPTAKPVEGAEPVPGVSVEDQARLTRLNGDLRWLVAEGYVTEFIDGRLFAPPPMVEARKKEIEGAEHDPENFPEVPVSSETPAAPAVAAESVVAEPAAPEVVASEAVAETPAPAPEPTVEGTEKPETPAS